MSGASLGRWSARCDCYAGHYSASGRCQERNVNDPTAHHESDAVYCETCRSECPTVQRAVQIRERLTADQAPGA